MSYFCSLKDYWIWISNDLRGNQSAIDCRCKIKKKIWTETELHFIHDANICVKAQQGPLIWWATSTRKPLAIDPPTNREQYLLFSFSKRVLILCYRIKKKKIEIETNRSIHLPITHEFAKYFNYSQPVIPFMNCRCSLNCISCCYKFIIYKKKSALALAAQTNLHNPNIAVCAENALNIELTNMPNRI